MNAPFTHPEAGLVEGISNDDYHRMPHLSKSQLSDFMVSPENYYRLHRDPNRPLREETPSMRIGTLTHCLTLEPDAFEERYAVGPDVSRATKDWKQWDAMQAPHKVRIKPDEHAASLAQAQSLRAHTEISELLSSGRPEVSAFWRDEETGLLLRCRPDWLHETSDGWIILDVKTTSDKVSPSAFARTCATYGYGVQAALYSEGVEKATGKPVLAFLFGVVSTSYPYLSSCCMFDDDSLASAHKQYRAALTAYADCKEKGEWPGYSGVQIIRLPAWALAQPE